jgi:multiple sugar transport system substrate-binding protein
LLRLAGVGLAGLTAAACAPKVVEVTKVVEKLVKETVVQEKLVKETVVQEKVVKETVVVEKKQPTPAPAKFDVVHWADFFLTTTDAKYKPYQDAVVKSFKDKFPNATPKFEDHGWDDGLRQNLVTALLAGTGPDVIVGENYFQQYADMGAMVPIDDMIQDIKDNLVPGTIKAAVTKNGTYGLSERTGVFGFERSPSLIERAGIDPTTPPKTWDELLDHCQKITKVGKGKFFGYTLQGPMGWPLAGIFRMSVYIGQCGASLCKDDCTYPSYNDPKAEQALTFLREINKYTPPGLTFNPDEGQVYQQMYKGVTAYQICGSWHTGNKMDEGLKPALYSIVPLPKDGKPTALVVGNSINGVLTVSKHKVEAITLCKVIVEDAIQDMVYPVFNLLPTIKSALQRLLPKVKEADKAFVNTLLTANVEVLPQWRKDPQKLWQAYDDMLVKLFTTNQPVKQLMEEAQQAAEAIMKA